MSYFDLKQIIPEIKKNTLNIENIFNAILNTSIKLDYNKKIVKVECSNNTNKSSGILILSNIDSINTKITLEIEIIQCSKPILEIKDSNFNTLKVLELVKLRDNIYTLEVFLCSIFNINYFRAPCNLFILESICSVPKQIYNINKLIIENLDNNISCPVNIVNHDNSHANCKGSVDYFRLFPDIAPLTLPIESYTHYSDNAIIDLVDTSNFNMDIPTGYNIFAQFMVHDMTFNSLGKITGDPASFINHETIQLDLHCLYGASQDVFYFHEDKFIYNEDNNDLFRNYHDKPVIPDKRNEENFLIAQIHILFMKFHNKLIDYYKPTIKSKLFQFVKQQVVFYYQWLIINDFLPKWVDKSIIDKIRYNYQFIYNPHDNDALPLEWAVSAARSGHLNFPSHIKLSANNIIEESQLHVLVDGILPSENIDWYGLFSTDLTVNDMNYCKKYDGKIIKDLANMIHLPKPPDLPSEKNNLLLRNLLRSEQFKLASGQNYAKKFKIQPLSEDLLKSNDTDGLLEKTFMTKETPLLLYIMKEAEIYKFGNKLTGLGGMLFTEPIISILNNDKNSYINNNEMWWPVGSDKPSKKWTPIITGGNSFTFIDLINFVNN